MQVSRCLTRRTTHNRIPEFANQPNKKQHSTRRTRKQHNSNRPKTQTNTPENIPENSLTQNINTQ